MAIRALVSCDKTSGINPCPMGWISFLLIEEKLARLHVFSILEHIHIMSVPSYQYTMISLSLCYEVIGAICVKNVVDFIFSSYSGLMGNWTFDMDDDFTLPDGHVGAILDTSQIERTHNDFAMKWVVHDKEEEGIG